MVVLSANLFGQAREAGDRSSPTKAKGFSIDPERLVVGGSFGAQFGDYTLVDLSPTLGYLVRDELLVGVGARYIYLEDRRFLNYTFKTNVYGGNVFSQFYFLENLILHAEYEVLNLEDFSDLGNRINISSVLVGGGYRSMIGDVSYFSLLLLYNLNETENSPYTNPILRINFGFGL